jgi:hypothetical protein
VRRALEVPLLAAAVWVVAFWWLRLLPWPWGGPVVILGAVSFCAGLLLWNRGPDLQSALVWICALGVFSLLAASAPVPPGVDAAMHAAVGRILQEAHGHPIGFRPLWPIDFFHSYPVGHPTLLALFGALGGLDARATAVTGHAAAYGLALVAFAAAVGRSSGAAPSGLVAGTLTVLAARDPIHFWTWGGAPNALALGFAVATLASGIDALRGDARSAAVCGLYAAASALTHTTSIVALAWTAPFLLAGAAILRPRLRRGVPLVAGAGLVAAILAAPYLVTLRPILGPSELEWIRRSAHETATLAILPRMLHDVPLIAGGLAAGIVLVRRPRRATFPLALLSLLALLILNGRIFFLPGSAVLYPDRTAVLALYPLALLGHEALRGLGKAALAVCAVLLVHSVFLGARTIDIGRGNALATPADLRLLAAADLPEDCAVANNYGDAGQWIPALRDRPITTPHVHVVFFDEVHGNVHPCAAFRGEKRPYFIDTIPCPGAACEPWRSEGGARLYRIVDPALEVRIDQYR